MLSQIGRNLSIDFERILAIRADAPLAGRTLTFP
jgi:hypothetical protein